jgi:FtsP/CotA-like multicopper oxidase with cupredoxin domain
MMTQREKRAWNAAKNRRELIEAGFSRRDLAKMGLLIGAGYLVLKGGLSARADGKIESPPTEAFIEPLSIMPTKQAVASLTPAPTAAPNTAAGEGRTRSHQAFPPNFGSRFAPRKLYEIHQRAAQVSMSPDLPMQTIWGYDGMTPGPTFIAHYGEPILVRNFNDLPPRTQNDGVGLPSVTTHLHNGHTPSESDGFPCDFFERGQFYDHHYPNVLAGFKETHPPDGDPNEMMSFLWYHDHRHEFTSQNVYKGLAGFYLLFDNRDTGDETTGFHLPGVPHTPPTPPEFDIPMMFADKVFDPRIGLLFFDLFNLDGILGDKFLVNGKIQPFFQVHPRRYRFRWLNTGPSRFLELFLTDPNNLSAHHPFWQISHDGNLLPRPLLVESVGMSVAERSDVIVDFSQFPPGSSLFIENRLEQKDGRGPTNRILPAGQGNLLLRFDVVLPPVADNSADPATITHLLDVPAAPQNIVTREFRFDRQNGMWAINSRLMDDDCETIRFRARQNTTGNEGEIWTFLNKSGGWQHPIHPHFEEFVILTRNGQPPPSFEVGRDDVARLNFNEEIVLFRRHRDFLGRYPLHCHNVVHEDHAMMLRFDVEPVGDTNPTP